MLNASIARSICALCLLLNGQLAESPATPAVSTSPQIRKPIAQPRPEVRSLLQKAAESAKSSRWQEALRGYDAAFTIANSLSDQAGRAAALTSGGYVRLNTVRPQRAQQDFERAAVICAATGDRAGEARAVFGLGLVLTGRGLPRRALDTFEQAQSLYTELADNGGRARSLRNIAMLQRDLGQTRRALTSFERTLQIFKTIPDPTGEASALMGIGALYSSMGQPTRALDFFSQAMPIFIAHGDARDHAVVLQDIGAVYLSTGRPQDALTAFQEGLAICRASRYKTGVARALQSMGLAYRNLGRLRQALNYFEMGLPFFKAAGERVDSARTLANIGNVYRDTSQPEKALDYLKQALQLFTATTEREGQVRVLDNLAQVEQTLSRPQDALGHLRQAVAVLERLRGSLGGLSAAKRDFLASRLYIYYHCLTLLIKQGQTEEAFDLAERTRARSLLDLLTFGRVDLSRVLTADERSQEEELRQRADFLNSQMIKEGVENEPGAKDHFAVLEEELRKTEDSLRTLSDALYARHPALSRRRPAKTATLVEIARSLPADTALLEYTQVSREGVVLFVVTSDGGAPTVRSHWIAPSAEGRDNQCSGIRTACGDPRKAWRSACAIAYRQYVGPASDQIDGKRRLIICPDGPLWDIPFATLLDSRGTPLLDRYELVMAFSATAMKATLDPRPAPRPHSGSLLAFANPDFGTAGRFGDLDGMVGQRPVETPSRPFDAPSRPIDVPSRAFDAPSREMAALAEPGGSRILALPGTQREADALLRDFPDAKVFTGSQAQEDTARQEMGRFRYVHFATHGFFNDASPMLSSIVLAKPAAGSRDDGFLTAREIFDLDLSGVELTVLSACNTARGQTRNGEGVIGLTWALFAAGCPTQVVSQWSVDDDSTATLMEGFYRNLTVKHRGKASALRESEQDLRSDGRHAHPYYWAPFIILGNWN